MDWIEANEHFLDLALEWLYLRLRLHIQFINVDAVTESTRKRGGLFNRRPDEEGHDILPADVTGAYQEMDKFRNGMSHPPALDLLRMRFELSEFEQNVLLLCAGLELDPRLGALCSVAQGGLANPTFALTIALFPNPSWNALSPVNPLRRWRLIEISQPGAQPLTTSPLRADERIVSFIKGMTYVDDRLAPLLIPFDAPLPDRSGYLPLPPSQQAVADDIAFTLSGGGMGKLNPSLDGEGFLIQMAGPDGLSKQLIALEAVRLARLGLYRLPVEWLPHSASELETLARLWEREVKLQPVALYLDGGDGGFAGSEGGGGPEAGLSLPRFLARLAGIVFLDTRELRPDLGRSGMSLDIAKPLNGEQAAAWSEFLGAEAAGWPQRLAGQFSLNIPTILSIVDSAQSAESAVPAQAPEQPAVNHDSAENNGTDKSTDSESVPQPVSNLGGRAWQICLRRTRPRLDQLAQRIDPKANWEDIELPAEQTNLLDEICGQVDQRTTVYETWGLGRVMNRGLGISALFAGESGTGKTMAAEVIANALNLNLYRIDLSAVVSKYIGETEKNLARLFDAAQDGGVILFFDEADALFGKRSEVKDSHDRYANIEINYLLQGMEAYRGLAILATNQKSSLDQAFMRRLRFIVNFPFPGASERRSIWQKTFPPGVPLGELDYDRLARFNLTGGSIHNVSVNAAFLAARQPEPLVTMDLVYLCLKGELRKIEKSINERDFILPVPAGGGV
jgi:hypothetical protein